MPRTLLIGANSFVAAHVITALIAAGHSVTGTVRRASSGDEIFAFHPEWKEHLDIVVVEDITHEPSWDAIFTKTNFDHIVHVAAPLLDDPGNTDYDKNFLTPSIEGNLALLRAALKHAPDLKSIAVTGSINAATTGSPEELAAGPITTSTWLPITREQARAMNNAYISYCSGKKEGELAIWDFIKQNNPHFTVTVLMPALIFGPPIEPLKGGVKGLHYSSKIIYSLIDGSNETVPPTSFPSYIDVRDLADAHVRALTEPKVANKRIIVGGLSVTYTAMVHALAKVPELKGRKLPADSGEDEKVTPARIDATEGNEALKMKFRSLEETMADAARRLLELEKA